MNVKKGPFFLFLISIAAGLPGYSLCAQDADLIQRRIQALNAATEGQDADPLARLAEFRNDPNALVRCAAVRSLAKIGTPALDLLRSYATEDTDALVRRTAVRAFGELTKGEALVLLLKTVLEHDKEETVRLAAVEELASMVPRTPEILALLQKTRGDTSHPVSQCAANALWDFDGEAVSARERSEYRDTHLDATRIDLPGTGWRFKVDPTQTGHLQNWISAAFDDRQWAEVEIARPWRDFGFNYEGVAWYRLKFKLPESPAHLATDLVFDAVDEAAWVWVNDEFLGAHDIGPTGFNVPFAADTRDLLKWGEENTIVVRVSKPSGGHAGIWKPVYLEVLNK